LKKYALFASYRERLALDGFQRLSNDRKMPLRTRGSKAKRGSFPAFSATLFIPVDIPKFNERFSEFRRPPQTKRSLLPLSFSISTGFLYSLFL
jgi:hypothetical protein